MKLDLSFRLFRRLAIVAIFAILPMSVSARTWTSTDGKTLEATFVANEGDSVQLRLANGNVIAVPKDRFIKADQEAAERFEFVGDDTVTKQAARQIDNLLAVGLKKNGFNSFNDPLPDDLFVRRVYLDIVGRIPTREEFMKFAESARSDKREALIDELLASPGYASHMFNYFADMYRVHDTEMARTIGNGISFETYTNWWRQSMEENKPYDQIVTEMITATGNLGQNPASGFILRDTGMEFDAFANFSQTLLGIDISCAQCHDHPFEDWTQMDFYQMAAFFGNTQRRPNYRTNRMMMSAGKDTIPNAPAGWTARFEKWAAENHGYEKGNRNREHLWVRDYLGSLALNVYDNENLETLLPYDFRGKGGDPNEPVRPATLVGGPAKMGGKITRRDALARWLTDAENPRFALNIANRMWSRAFGRALVEPVTDFSDDMLSRVDQQDTLKFVTSHMKRVNYDLREFMRSLYYTRAYQSISSSEEPDWADSYYFQGPILRRMRAEQVWDSLMLLSEGPEIDERSGGDGLIVQAALDIDFENETFEQVWAKQEAYNNVRGRNYGVTRLLEPGTLEFESTKRERLRASEMKQPLGGDLLATFGQSERIITDQHDFDGSVPQVLALMNGNVTKQMTGKSSTIVEDVSQFDGPDDQVRGVFFTILSRYPTKEELKLGMSMVEDFGDDGISDLAWALLNSPEFLFVQ